MSVILGHHVSKLFWTPTIDEVLTVIAEDGNRHDRWRSAAQFESRELARTRLWQVYTPVSSSFATLACPALFGSTDEELAARHSLPPRSYFVILHMRLTRSTKDG